MRRTTVNAVGIPWQRIQHGSASGRELTPIVEWNTADVLELTSGGIKD